jgi:A/G-specific adenine glycosylase
LTTREMRRRLVAYYRHRGRPLPWRGTRDPYRVWVSEVMLQQTRVATAMARYEGFLQRFPDVRRLAEASREAVSEAWAGLGYYRRAQNMHAAAAVIQEEHEGRFPSTYDGLRALPGVGRYTAGAIASIAFGQRVPAVDGNVERVLSRLYAVEQAPSSARGARRIHELARELVVAGPDPGDVNQALMDLGSLVCTPRAPRCQRCPVRVGCAAFTVGRPLEYPRRAARRSGRVELRVAFLWRASRMGVWLERRAATGLWAGQWQLPGAEGERCTEELAHRFGVRLRRRIVEVRHELTHRRVVASVYDYEGDRRWRRADGFRPFSTPLSAPISALARRAIAARLVAGDAREIAKRVFASRAGTGDDSNLHVSARR